MFARFRIYTAVLDRYFTFGLQLVEGFALLQVALKPMVKACNLIPSPHVAIDVKSRYCCCVDVGSLCRAADPGTENCCAQ